MRSNIEKGHHLVKCKLNYYLFFKVRRNRNKGSQTQHEPFLNGKMKTSECSSSTNMTKIKKGNNIK